MYQVLAGLLIVLIPLSGFALGGYFLIHLHNEDILDRRAKRYRHRTTYNYDANGNPQYIYNPETETLIIPPSANPSFAPTILIRDSIQRNIKPDKEQPLLININGGQKVANIGVEGEVISVEDISDETSSELKLPISEGEKLNYIDKCLERGIGITKAARAINITPGGTKGYKNFEALWDLAVAKKDRVPYLK